MVEPVPEAHIIERARKLLRLRERAGSAGEAAAAAKALALLLDKHRLDVAALEAGGAQDGERFVADTDRPLASWQRVEPWRRNLALVLAAHFGCCCWQQGFRAPGFATVHYLHVCGRPSDVELVRGMYHWLASEATRLSASECRGRGASYARSWRAGFVTGIERQLAVARGELTETDSRALVLYDRGRQAAEYLKGLNERLGTVTVSSRQRLDARGYVSGRRMGTRIHLGGRIDGPLQAELDFDE